MDLQERLTAELKTAMLEGKSMAVSVLRMLKSELKNAEIATGRVLEETETLAVIRREVKKRKESAQAFRQAGHADRASEEEAEAGVLTAYLPAALDPALIEQFVQEYIKTNLTTPSAKDRGTVIKATLAHFQGTAEGGEVSQIASRLLP